jgi:hypothetical protein
MKALTFHFSYPRFVAGKIFGGLSRGGPLVYEDVPDAKLLGDDWVIVETRYCGICGSDVKQALRPVPVDRASEHMHTMKTPTRQTAATSKDGFSNFALRTPLSAH